MKRADVAPTSQNFHLHPPIGKCCSGKREEKEGKQAFLAYNSVISNSLQGNACFPSFSSCFPLQPLPMGGCKWKLCKVGVASALFIRAAYDYNTIVSNSTACPFLGDVSGSFVTSQSSIGCFMYSICLSYCTPSGLGYTCVIVHLSIVTY